MIKLKAWGLVIFDIFFGIILSKLFLQSDVMTYNESQNAGKQLKQHSLRG